MPVDTLRLDYSQGKYIFLDFSEIFWNWITEQFFICYHIFPGVHQLLSVCLHLGVAPKCFFMYLSLFSFTFLVCDGKICLNSMQCNSLLVEIHKQRCEIVQNFKGEIEKKNIYELVLHCGQFLVHPHSRHEVEFQFFSPKERDHYWRRNECSNCTSCIGRSSHPKICLLKQFEIINQVIQRGPGGFMLVMNG